ncbi:MlaD domain-containing protein [Psidium guajava]|nr:MlaD domain-containing protein [Psidium guajava]
MGWSLLRLLIRLCPLVCSVGRPYWFMTPSSPHLTSYGPLEKTHEAAPSSQLFERPRADVGLARNQESCPESFGDGSLDLSWCLRCVDDGLDQNLRGRKDSPTPRSSMRRLQSQSIP